MRRIASLAIRECGRAVWVCAVSLCLSFDIINIVGGYIDPELPGHAACATLPRVEFVRPIVSTQLLEFAQHQCDTTHPSEPTFSVIFLMAKVQLAFLTIPLSKTGSSNLQMRSSALQQAVGQLIYDQQGSSSQAEE